MNIAIVIPARLESTRLKHKMLMMFDGIPLIRLVFDKCRTMGYDCFVVTDSKKIAQHISRESVIMSDEAENGTARIRSVLKKLEGYDTIINIQGDMLDISYQTVKPFIDRAKHDFSVYTGYTKGCEPSDVKVIHQAGKAMWFTRAPIGYGDRHIGIYMYRPQALCAYDLLEDEYPEENLEQNRFLGLMDVKVCDVIYDVR